MKPSQVLAGRSAPSAAGLVAVANGWPAVIGLAGVSNVELEDSEQLPESLYRFFAEEVFASLDDEVKAGLATLAVAPVLDRELASELLGSERAELVCGRGARSGHPRRAGRSPRAPPTRALVPRGPVRAARLRSRARQRCEDRRALHRPTRMGRCIRRHRSKSPRDKSSSGSFSRRSTSCSIPPDFRRSRRGVRWARAWTQDAGAFACSIGGRSPPRPSLGGSDARRSCCKR